MYFQTESISKPRVCLRCRWDEMSGIDHFRIEVSPDEAVLFFLLKYVSFYIACLSEIKLNWKTEEAKEEECRKVAYT